MDNCVPGLSGAEPRSLPFSREGDVMAGIDATKLSGLLPPSAGGVLPTPARGPGGGADSGRVDDAVVFNTGQGWKSQGRAASTAIVGPWPAPAAVRAYGDQAGPGTKDAGRPAGEAGQNQSETSEETPAAVDRVREGGDGQEDRVGQAQDRKPNGEPLNQAEAREVAQLQRTDVEVRAHEQAHLTAAGHYARGGATFDYKEGPDGKRYAVAGEVAIDTSREADPAKTISKMAVVRAAALAPANPSPQDRRVAAKATSLITDAQTELRLEQLAEAEAAREDSAGKTPAANAAGETGREAAGRTEAAQPPVVLAGKASEGEQSPRRAYPIIPSANLDSTRSTVRRAGIDLVV